MKKVLCVLLVAILCCGMIAGCGKKEEVNTGEQEELITETEEIDGFEKAEYDKFNSYASENGLGDTPIYIEGKVLNQTIVDENSEFPILNFVVEQEDGNRWLASIISDTEIKDIEEKQVRIFGTYTGFSDVFNLPAMAVIPLDEDKMKLARVEVEDNGEYTEIWNYYDNYAKQELENSSISANDSEQSAETTPKLTTGQSNALASAKLYLETMPFSYTGLIEQLEYEQYSTEDATYAADNCGADWNEQAARSAKNYLDIMPFSRDELIEQLQFEGYTYEQAVYGVEQNGY